MIRYTERRRTELLIEREIIQKSLSENKSVKTIAELSKNFKNYMKKGNVNAALKLVTSKMKDAILLIKNETLNSLKEKHPESKNANNDVLLTSVSHRLHAIMFAGIKQIIGKSAIKTKGGTGPLAMDADGWRRILCLNNFGNTNVNLRKSLANLSRRFVQRKYQPFPSKHWLHSDSSLLTKIRVYDQMGLVSLCQCLRKKLFHLLGHRKYVKAKRLDPKQLYML